MYKNQVIIVFGHRGSGKTTWLFKHFDGFMPCVLVDPLFDPKFERLKLYHLDNLEEAKELFRNGHPQRIYCSPNLDTFDYLCGLILAKGELTLIVDEVDSYCTPYYISPYFKKLVKYGRHRAVNLVCCCRRPTEMSPLIRSQANRFVIFPLSAEDAKLLESYTNKQVRERIPELVMNDFGSEYIDFDFSSKCHDVKAIRYVDVPDNVVQFRCRETK